MYVRATFGWIFLPAVLTTPTQTQIFARFLRFLELDSVFLYLKL